MSNDLSSTIAKVTELMARATPGPWTTVPETDASNFLHSIYGEGYKGLLIARCDQNGEHSDDAALIVEAINALPLFLDALSPTGPSGDVEDPWQSMDTAPQDGQTIQLLERTWGGDLIVTPGKWVGDFKDWWEHGSWPTDYANQPIDNPLAWQPLALPPALGPDEGAGG